MTPSRRWRAAAYLLLSLAAWCCASASPGATSPADAHYRHGVASEREGRIQDAANSYQSCLAADPKDTRARFGLATLLQRVGRQAEATKLYLQVVALEKGSDLVGRMRSLKTARDRRRVSPRFRERIIAFLASTLEAAKFRFSEGDLDAAAERFHLLVSLDPKNKDARLGLAGVHHQRGDWSENVKELRGVLRMSPEDPEVWKNLGVVLALAGSTSDAVGAYSKVGEPPAEDCAWSCVVGDSLRLIPSSHPTAHCTTRSRRHGRWGAPTRNWRWPNSTFKPKNGRTRSWPPSRREMRILSPRTLPTSTATC